MAEPTEVREYRGKLIVKVPMPRYDGSQHCVGEEMYSPDADSFPTQQAASVAAFYFYRSAKQVCDGCPFLDDCRDYAIAHEFDGMWGGLTPKQRMLARRERGWMLTSPMEMDVRFGSQHDTEEEAA